MKKILFKIVSVVFCALLMVVPFVPEGGVMKVNAATMQFGLTVDDDGTVLLNGTPFTVSVLISLLPSLIIGKIR